MPFFKCCIPVCKTKIPSSTQLKRVGEPQFWPQFQEFVQEWQNYEKTDIVCTKHHCQIRGAAGADTKPNGYKLRRTLPFIPEDELLTKRTRRNGYRDTYHEDEYQQEAQYTLLNNAEQDSLLNNAEQDDSLLNNADQDDSLLNNADQDNSFLNNAEQDSLLNNAEQDSLLNNAEQDSFLNNAEQDSLLNNAEQDSLLNNAEQDSLLNNAEQDSLLNNDEQDGSLLNSANQDDSLLNNDEQDGSPLNNGEQDPSSTICHYQLTNLRFFQSLPTLKFSVPSEV
ncbi:Halomucin [Folsomia candida]|uniref:Halomucin n=1 Tax=Folsomia candida TaxID=158441 RepID=A0A226D7A6_FOLCA|nr:Halomucin [Folsomia candida]